MSEFLPELFKRNPVKIGGHSAVDILIESEGDDDDDKSKTTKKKGKAAKFEFPKASLEKSVTPMEAKKRVMDARDATGNPVTEAQASVGNYKKGRFYMHGMEFMLENPKGSVRSGVDSNGNAWSVRLKCDYGYIRRTEGYDGDQVDVFFGPNPESEIVFVVNQVIGGEFDEHKCMFGFNTIDQAKTGYLENYQDDWKGLGSIVPMTIPQFKTWVQSAKQGPAVIDLQKGLIAQLVRSELYKSTGCGANGPGGGGFQPGNTCGSLGTVDGLKLPANKIKVKPSDMKVLIEYAEEDNQTPAEWIESAINSEELNATDFVSGWDSYQNKLYTKIEKHIEDTKGADGDWHFGGQYYEDWISDHINEIAVEKIRDALKDLNTPELVKAFKANCRWVTLNSDNDGGTRVCIGGDGKINVGPKGLLDRNISNLKEDPKPTVKPSRADAKSWEIPKKTPEIEQWINEKFARNPNQNVFRKRGVASASVAQKLKADAEKELGSDFRVSSYSSGGRIGFSVTSLKGDFNDGHVAVLEKLFEKHGIVHAPRAGKPQTVRDRYEAGDKRFNAIDFHGLGKGEHVTSSANLDGMKPHAADQVAKGLRTALQDHPDVKLDSIGFIDGKMTSLGQYAHWNDNGTGTVRGELRLQRTAIKQYDPKKIAERTERYNARIEKQAAAAEAKVQSASDQPAKAKAQADADKLKAIKRWTFAESTPERYVESVALHEANHAIYYQAKTSANTTVKQTFESELTRLYSNSQDRTTDGYRIGEYAGNLGSHEYFAEIGTGVGLGQTDQIPPRMLMAYANSVNAAKEYQSSGTITKSIDPRDELKRQIRRQVVQKLVERELAKGDLCHWRTLESGTKVCIGDKGEIKLGPSALTGTRVGETKEQRKQRIAAEFKEKHERDWKDNLTKARKSKTKKPWQINAEVYAIRELVKRERQIKKDIQKHYEWFAEFRRSIDDWDTSEEGRARRRELRDQWDSNWNGVKNNAKRYKDYWPEHASDAKPDPATTAEYMKRYETWIEERLEGPYVHNWEDRDKHQSLVREAIESGQVKVADIGDALEDYQYSSWLPDEFKQEVDRRRYIKEFTDWHASEQTQSEVEKLKPKLTKAKRKYGKIVDEVYADLKKREDATSELWSQKYEADLKLDAATKEFEKYHNLGDQENLKKAEQLFEQATKQTQETRTAWEQARAADKAYARELIASKLSGGGSVEWKGEYAEEKNVQEAGQFIAKAASPKMSGFAMEVKSFTENDTDNRAYHIGGNMHISLYDAARVVVHEWGHAVEYNHLEIARASRAFYAMKTKGKELVHMSKAYGDFVVDGFHQWEFAAKDAFPDPYVAKFYSSGSTEILSMGVDRLYEDPRDFLERSRDHAIFTLAALNGDFSE